MDVSDYKRMVAYTDFLFLLTVVATVTVLTYFNSQQWVDSDLDHKRQGVGDASVSIITLPDHGNVHSLIGAPVLLHKANDSEARQLSDQRNRNYSNLIVLSRASALYAQDDVMGQHQFHF
jgi:hypothetical protein